MRIAVVGAGPTGLFSAIALARAGHRVGVIDRDAGPPDRGSWKRSGVMQFRHAHAFRGPAVETLCATMPDVIDNLVAAGAVIESGDDGRPTALLCRRSTFDTVLHSVARAEPDIALVTGHVDEVVVRHGRATGLRVDGSVRSADLILDASGRASRFAAAHRTPAEVGDCGVSYLTRHYVLNAGATEAERNSPIGLGLSFPGYWAIVFRQDSRTFAVMLSHDGDRRLRRLSASIGSSTPPCG